MNSKNKITKIGKKTSHRKLLINSLVNDLIIYEHLITTKTKSVLVLKRFTRLMTNANKRSNDKLNLERFLSKELRNGNAIRKVMEVLLKRFKDTKYGFVKSYKLGNRKGDNAENVKLILLGYEYKDIGRKVKAKNVEKHSPKDEQSSQSRQYVQPKYKDNKQNQFSPEANLTKTASRSESK